MHAAPLPPPRPRNPRRIPSLNREQQLGGGRRVHRYSSEEMAAQMANCPTFHLKTEKLGTFMDQPQASGLSLPFAAEKSEGASSTQAISCRYGKQN